MEVVIDLAPEIVQMLDYHSTQIQADRSSFLNYIIALYDQNTREYHQQVQQVQQSAGGIEYVEGLEPLESIPRKSFKLHREYNTVPHAAKKPTGMRQKPKAVPKRAAVRKMR